MSVRQSTISLRDIKRTARNIKPSHKPHDSEVICCSVMKICYISKDIFTVSSSSSSHTHTCTNTYTQTHLALLRAIKKSSILYYCIQEAQRLSACRKMILQENGRLIYVCSVCDDKWDWVLPSFCKSHYLWWITSTRSVNNKPQAHEVPLWWSWHETMCQSDAEWHVLFYKVTEIKQVLINSI